MSLSRSRVPLEEAEITQRLYEDYRNLRKKLFQDLCRRQWMIFARHGIDIQAYPAMKRHLLGGARRSCWNGT